MTININKQKYLIEKNYKDGYNEEELLNKYTDYFNEYDYILGDYSYNKLRLKGFNDKKNKNYNKVNDIKEVDNYIKNYCAYDCRYFLLKKIK